jgi:hypothetical protein
MIRMVTWGVGAAMLAGLALLSLGCGPGASAYCEDRRACMGGNDQDEVACRDRFDTAETLIDDQGCSSEFDDYFQCFFDNAKCVSSPPAGQCTTTDNCSDAPFGATCQRGECVVKDLALQSATVCAKEKLLFDSCNTLSADPFQPQ